MHYSEKQVKYILRDASRNVRNAILRDGSVFINDVSLKYGNNADTIDFTFRGTPVDLHSNSENMKKAVGILQRAYNKNARTQKVRSFFQKLSDTLTCNYKLEELSEPEIKAWFALDKINKNKSKVKVKRYEYMNKVVLGDIELISFKDDSKPNRFAMLVNNSLVFIEHDVSNKHLYNRVRKVFFDSYSLKTKTR